jgi:hypothetical protein
MVGHCPEGHVTYPRNMGMEEMSRRWGRMESPSEGWQGPEGIVSTINVRMDVRSRFLTLIYITVHVRE